MTFGVEPWMVASRDTSFKIGCGLAIASGIITVGGMLSLIAYQLHNDKQEFEQRNQLGIEKQFTPTPERE